MKTALALAFIALFASPIGAADADLPIADVPILQGKEADLNEFLWIKRPVVVFADSPADPRFVQQINALSDRLDDLAERDVVIITDTDPSNPSAIREKLRPRGFMLVLIGKDGMVKLRKPVPWDVRELSRSIDKMPLRQQEIDERP